LFALPGETGIPETHNQKKKNTCRKENLRVMVNNSTNINKTQERLNSDGQQFYQYQQNKRKIKQ
jgi:hypothetical protein